MCSLPGAAALGINGPESSGQISNFGCFIVGQSKQFSMIQGAHAERTLDAELSNLYGTWIAPPSPDRA